VSVRRGLATRFPWLFGAVLTALVAGCAGPRGAAPPPPPEPRPAATADNAARAANAWIPPAIPIPEKPVKEVPLTPPSGKGAAAPSPSPAPAAPPPGPVAAVPTPPAAAGTAGGNAPSPPPPGPEPTNPGEKAARASSAATRVEVAPARGAPSASASPATRKPVPRPTEAEGLAAAAPVPQGPAWARQKEVLSYRVDFIGITMGYARFRYQGKVSIGGRVAYHLNVRAWTSGVLSYIYPINETIDYYLDAETLAPLRQEFTERERKDDDVAIYDQKTGKITYRYRASGQIRKEVETVPEIYDPVSAVYYYRWRDLGERETARNVYAGRKVWEISARVVGTERMKTSLGDIDTLVVQPIIRRDGKPADKGDLRMWVSNDDQRVPVRLYAKFHKIKDWTLVGELVPAEGGG
jgi:Protein of unknown function (DUF3108)